VEYTYRKGPRNWIILYGILIVLALLSYLLDIATYGFMLYRLFSYLAIPLVFISFMIYSIFRYYKRVSTDLISLDDSAIARTRKGIVTKITWDEVTKVEWRGKDADKYSALTILSADKVIGIGEHIDRFGEIIHFIKLKVEGRFNTYNIPWELKNPPKELKK
jgi:hypothetical protein